MADVYPMSTEKGTAYYDPATGETRLGDVEYDPSSGRYYATAQPESRYYSSTPIAESDKVARVQSYADTVSGIITSLADFYAKINYEPRPANTQFRNRLYREKDVGRMPTDVPEPRSSGFSGLNTQTMMFIGIGIVVLMLVMRK